MNAWQRYKQQNGVTFIDMFKQIERISLEDAQKRYDVCQNCPEFISSTKQCKMCLCFMNLKTKLAEAKCPLGKW